MQPKAVNQVIQPGNAIATPPSRSAEMHHADVRLAAEAGVAMLDPSLRRVEQPTADSYAGLANRVEQSTEDSSSTTSPGNRAKLSDGAAASKLSDIEQPVRCSSHTKAAVWIMVLSGLLASILLLKFINRGLRAQQYI